MQNDERQENNNKLSLTINGKEHGWHEQYITGLEIRKLGSIPADDEIFLKIKEPWKDEPILDQTKVDLARPGIEHFYSKESPKQIIIIVNGREKPWNEREITFQQVVILAFGSYEENQNRVYTVTFKGGPDRNPQGAMVKGDKVFVKNRMVFNVTATDKS
jgi:Multiubiquitin